MLAYELQIGSAEANRMGSMNSDGSYRNVRLWPELTAQWGPLFNRRSTFASMGEAELNSPQKAMMLRVAHLGSLHVLVMANLEPRRACR